MRTLHIDYETFSPVDLIKCGVHRYAEEAEIIMVQYAFDDEPVRVIDVLQGEVIPTEVMDALRDPTVIKKAANAAFERTITKACLGIECPPEQWRCTLVHAASVGLPGNLGKLTEVMKLGEKGKDKAGKALIRKFCLPCKPTKKNGHRTRNLPEHFPDDWERFKSYGHDDVVAEREVDNRLSRYPMPEVEWRMWFLDQRINDNGVKIDVQLVTNAIKIANELRERMFARAQEITGLTNPNSRNQLIDWLDSEDIVTQTLTKKDVEQLIGSTSNEKVQELLGIRLQMSKASVKKFEAVARAICKDGRLRGTLRFNGAGRTNRWAGQIFQPQNLPSKGLIRDVAFARELVKNDPDMATVLYDDVAQLLSSLLRPVLMAAEGNTYVDADFNAIEARILAFLANEEWRVELFKKGLPLYETSAEKMFNLPVGSVGKKDPIRQKGKVAELACFSPDTQVLTNAGFKAIVDVTTDDLLWDGEEWIQHKGLVNQGVQKVISLDGVEMTPNQLIFSNGSWKAASLLASNKSILSQALATGSENLPFCRSRQEAKDQESLQGVHAEELQKLHSTTSEAVEAPGVKSALRLKQNLLEKLNTISTITKLCLKQITGGGLSTDLGLPLLAATQSQISNTKVMAEEVSGCVTNGGKTPVLSLDTSGLSKGGTTHPWRWIESMLTKVTSLAISALSLDKLTDLTKEKLTISKPESETLKNVYDIALAGPRNRFTIVSNSGYLIVHNCGYQGWEGALIQMGALEMGLQVEDLVPILKAWRAANQAIEAYWYACEDAALKAVRGRCKVPVLTEYQQNPVVSYECDGNYLWANLPSGRRMYYAKPKVGTNDRGRAAVSYEGIDGTKKTWQRRWLYGGLLVENLCQAIARDCLRDTMLAWDRECPDLGDIVLHVHDQIIIETDELTAKLAEHELLNIMRRTLKWWPELELKGDGFINHFFMKED